MKILCSINKKVKNKNIDNFDKLTKNWENVELTAEELKQNIEKGFAFCNSQLKSSKKNKDNFLLSNSIWLDFDNATETKQKKTIQQGYIPFEKIISNQFAKENIFLVYTSPSNTSEWNRFRIVFVLPYIIEDPTIYKNIILKFIQKTNADPSPSSITNAFFGNTNATFFTNGSVIQQGNIDEIQKYNETENNQQYALNPNMTPELISEMLQHIPPKLQYIDWVRIISAVKKSGFPKNICVDLIENWSAGYPGEVAKKYDFALRNISIGTLFYFAKYYGWHAPRNFEKKEIPKKYGFTDADNSQRFDDNFNKILKYEHNSKHWYIFDSKRFVPDLKGEIYTFAEKIWDIIEEEIKNEPNQEKKKRIYNWKLRTQSIATVKNMLNFAKNKPKIACYISDFDTNRYIINLQNGVLNLENFDFQDHNPNQMLSKMIEIEYNPEAECTQWLNFLDDIFQKDKELINFIQRAIGYSLTGDTSEQCIFYCYGTGKNGKSVFFNVLQMLFGDYFQKAPSEMLIKKHNDNIPNDIARLKGARFVVTSELPEGQYFDEAKLKDLSGGDEITARFLNAEYFEFRPEFKLWLYGNHKMAIKGTDEGIWRRIKLIPFKYYVPESKTIKMEKLISFFQKELDGILQWALVGLQKWQESGLQTPEIVKTATKSYQNEMDVLQDYIDSNVISVTSAYSISQKELYKNYFLFCEENNIKPISNRNFFQKMEEKGFKRENSGHARKKMFVGITLKSEIYSNQNSDLPF